MVLSTGANARNESALLDQVIKGLSLAQAVIEPAYFYDALGSTLFDAICLLPEYTPPRTESWIFTEYRQQILNQVQQALGSQPVLIDLGAGNGRKAARLFSSLHPKTYLAVDVSEDYLRQSLLALQADYPEQDMLGLVQNFSNGLRLDDPAVAKALEPAAPLFFYPGSSIGNFEPDAAVRFLAGLRDATRGRRSGLLIGVDLLKAASDLEAAYDDPVGVTAAFNKNVLRHLSHRFQLRSSLQDWTHRAFFNAPFKRIEMHLVAQRPTALQTSSWKRDFDAGQSIHTEISCKYSVTGFSEVLQRSGYEVAGAWTDPQQSFAVFFAL
jgi:dimethylhistidine N-methyltransferase